MVDQRDLASCSVFVEELRLPEGLSAERRVERRRAALLEFDPLVRRALATLGAGLPAPTVDVTIYDAIYPSNPDAGGHWTAAALLIGVWTHAIWSYTVTLLFDAEDRPSRFAVHAASDVISDGASEAALRAALERARGRGPLQTVSSHVFSSIGL